MVNLHVLLCHLYREETTREDCPLGNSRMNRNWVRKRTILLGSSSKPSINPLTFMTVNTIVSQLYQKPLMRQTIECLGKVKNNDICLFLLIQGMRELFYHWITDNTRMLESKSMLGVNETLL